MGHLDPSRPCLMVITDVKYQIRKKAALTEAEKEEADKLKVEGNDLMRSEQFAAAIEKYTK